jgi:uncharacterized protein YcfJ
MNMKNIIIMISTLVVAVCVVAATTLYFVKSLHNNSAIAPAATVQATAAPATTAQAQAESVSPAAQDLANAQGSLQTQTERETMAQIVAVKPHMVKTSVPYTSCHQKSGVVMVQQNSGPPVAGAVIGGVAGGLLGNQIGHGGGRSAATVVGALGGALVGSSVQQSMNQPKAQRVVRDVCVEKTKTVEKQKGYEVTYIYKGEQGIRILQTKPIGTQIPIATLQAAPALEDVE